MPGRLVAGLQFRLYNDVLTRTVVWIAAAGFIIDNFQVYLRELRVEDLRDALEQGELVLNYQPLVDPNTNKVKCFEALMRWNTPEGDSISPAVFIPM